MKTKLVSVSAAESSNINLSFALFCKYENAVHKNNDSQFSDFNEFLVDSPLKVSVTCALSSFTNTFH